MNACEARGNKQMSAFQMIWVIDFSGHSPPSRLHRGGILADLVWPQEWQKDREMQTWGVPTLATHLQERFLLLHLVGGGV